MTPTDTEVVVVEDITALRYTVQASQYPKNQSTIHTCQNEPTYEYIFTSRCLPNLSPCQAGYTAPFRSPRRDPYSVRGQVGGPPPESRDKGQS